MKELLIEQADDDIDVLDALVRDHFNEIKDNINDDENNIVTYHLPQAISFLRRAARNENGTNAIKAKGWDVKQATQAILQEALKVHDNPLAYRELQQESPTKILGAVAMGIDVLTYDASVYGPRYLFKSIRDNYGVLVPEVVTPSKGPNKEWSLAAAIAGKALRQELKLKEYAQVEQTPKEKRNMSYADMRTDYLAVLEDMSKLRQMSSNERTLLTALVEEGIAEKDRRALAAEAIADIYTDKLERFSTRNGGLSEHVFVLPTALRAYATQHLDRDFLTWMTDTYRSRGEPGTFDDSVVREVVMNRISRDIRSLQNLP